jgi:hypothetical protein
LYHAYACRQLTSPFDLFPFLSVDASGDADFLSDMAALLPNLQEHVKRYFKGVGHPSHPAFTNVIASGQLDLDNQDSCYRVRRFVKLMSGISLLPSSKRSFTVCVFDYDLDAFD